MPGLMDAETDSTGQIHGNKIYDPKLENLKIQKLGTGRADFGQMDGFRGLNRDANAQGLMSGFRGASNDLNMRQRLLERQAGRGARGRRAAARTALSTRGGLSAGQKGLIREDINPMMERQAAARANILGQGQLGVQNAMAQDSLRNNLLNTQIGQANRDNTRALQNTASNQDNMWKMYDIASQEAANRAKEYQIETEGRRRYYFGDERDLATDRGPGQVGSSTSGRNSLTPEQIEIIKQNQGRGF